jgi:hypothetical protein
MRAIIANVITPAKNFNNELSQTICEPFSSPADFMAGAGIVVRNSIILVDFIEMRLAEGNCKFASFGRPVKPASRFLAIRTRQRANP